MASDLGLTELTPYSYLDSYAWHKDGGVFLRPLTERSDSAMHRPLRIPREWIERRLEQTARELSTSAIDSLVRERDSLPSADSVGLNCRLDVSYFPDKIEEIADNLGMFGADLLHSVQNDLSDGIAVRDTSWRTDEGRTKLFVLGARWRLVVWPRQGKNSGSPLCFLENLQRQNIPTKHPRFRPFSVCFHPIWDEVPCDLDELREAYARRKKAFGQISRELGRGQTDPVIQTRSDLHASVRRNYSALRVMMDLLKLRSEQEKHSIGAVVMEPGMSPGTEPANLRLQLVDQPPGTLEEDTLVEIHYPAWSRSQRTRIVSLTSQGGKAIVEVGLSADILQAGEDVQIQTVPRFGMWAHQRAVDDLLHERVEGYWPDLVRLLCSPDQLDVPAHWPQPERFFSDEDPDSPSLNDRQRIAVTGALATPHVFCVQGPPGTGKTTVICEVIQQLIAKGERILLAAPQHVAVDEVLRRISSREGVHALRLSWDEGRLAEDVRKFTPANIIDPFIERLQHPDRAKVDRWQKERDSISEARAMLQKLLALQKRRQMLQDQERHADEALRRAQENLVREGRALEARLEEFTSQIHVSETRISRLREELRHVKSRCQAFSAAATWWEKLLGWVGFGRLGSSRRWQRSVAKQCKEEEAICESLQNGRQAAEDHLGSLRAAVSDAEDGVHQASVLLAEAVRDERSILKSCAGHEMLREHDLSSEAAEHLFRELDERATRLACYKHLAGRFNELVAEVTEEGKGLEELRRDLLAVINLFCCTTTGVAGSPELRDLVFDTLIVDEASRVTDSEFLIGAVRAKRWILVGDEHQLPPYVEQKDEHFIHALSALHKAGATGKGLDEAVEELGRLWEEDEELHRFRRESVRSVAESIRDMGHWKSKYRDAYQRGIDFLRSTGDDPSRALLQAMRENLVHSLFERVVSSCPDVLKVRLLEQRRMIEPIASIVNEPVYGGEYQTPPRKDLAEHGITALTTPTFPKPVVFLDTSLLGKAARNELCGNSFVNAKEAEWIVEACERLDQELTQAGSPPVTVSILAFYKAQARLVRHMLDERLRLRKRRFACLRFSVIGPIDRIQGQESDVVFLSFCRTAGMRVGPRFGQWLQDLRRLNVACTRARRALIFVGQKKLLSRLRSNDAAVTFYRHLNDLFESRPDEMQVIPQFGGTP